MSAIGSGTGGSIMAKVVAVLPVADVARTAVTAFKMRTKNERRFMVNRMGGSNCNDADAFGCGFNDLQTDSRRQMHMKRVCQGTVTTARAGG